MKNPSLVSCVLRKRKEKNGIESMYDVEALWEREFASRIDSSQVYLDHAGCTLYAASQVRAHARLLSSSLYGNPHSSSASASSRRTSVAVAAVRRQVLAWFCVSEATHECVFTANATAAAKLVGEGFFADPDPSRLLTLYLARSNHNSILGIREYAQARRLSSTSSASASTSSITSLSSSVHVFDSLAELIRSPSPASGATAELVALPAQCNFSGVKEDLSLVQELVKRKTSGCRTYVLLDASSWVGHCRLSLEECPADFVALSFYKMFGFPTGVGCLVVRKDAAAVLHRRYFGGGTVAAALAGSLQHRLRGDSVAGRFEDGTVNFLDILAIPAGLAVLEELSLEAISAHCLAITQHAVRRLQSLTHHDGTPLVSRFYTLLDPVSVVHPKLQGPIVSFSLQTAARRPIGAAFAGKLAAINHIHLRTGTFCNPGAYQQQLCLSDGHMHRLFDAITSPRAGSKCWDAADMTLDGTPAGVIRISFGYMTRPVEIDKFAHFLSHAFLERGPAVLPLFDAENLSGKSLGRVQHLAIFPVKSCAPFVIPATTRWGVTAGGLAYDRQWMVVDAERLRVIQQKECPQMCLLAPSIDLKAGLLRIRPPGEDHDQLELRLDALAAGAGDQARWIQVRSCGRQLQAARVSEEADAWFSRQLGRECALVQTVGCESFSNDSHLLVLSTSSLQRFSHEYARAYPERCAGEVEWIQFRPNIVVLPEDDGVDGAAHQEDQWTAIRIGPRLRASRTARCSRCRMVNIDPETGETSARPFTTLARYRSDGKQVFFGSHFQIEQVEVAEEDTTIDIGIGDEIYEDLHTK